MDASEPGKGTLSENNQIFRNFSFAPGKFENNISFAPGKFGSKLNAEIQIESAMVKNQNQLGKEPIFGNQKEVENRNSQPIPVRSDSLENEEELKLNKTIQDKLPENYKLMNKRLAYFGQMKITFTKQPIQTDSSLFSMPLIKLRNSIY